MKKLIRSVLTRVRNFFIRQRTVTIVATTAVLLTSPVIGNSGLLSFISKLAAFAGVVSFLDALSAPSIEKRNEEVVNAVEGVAMMIGAAWASIYIAPTTVLGAVVAAFICQIIVSEFALLFVEREQKPRHLILVR